MYDLPYVLSLPVALLLALIILLYYFHQTAWKRSSSISPDFMVDFIFII